LGLSRCSWTTLLETSRSKGIFRNKKTESWREIEDFNKFLKLREEVSRIIPKKYGELKFNQLAFNHLNMIKRIEEMLLHPVRRKSIFELEGKMWKEQQKHQTS